MTLPQQRLPGTTYFITAVCERRECRLPPDAQTSSAIAVALYDAAERHGVRITAVSVPNNHLHLVVFDELGRVSEFVRDVKSVVARFGNTRDGVKGWGFWDRQGALCQVLGDAQTVVDKVAYTLANVTTSFLVPHPDAWPGLQTRIEDLGMWRGAVYLRPSCFFRANGRTSESVQVASEVPPMVEAAYGVAGFQRRVKAKVQSLVAEAHAAASDEGHGFVGIDRVLAQGVWHRPSSPSKRSAGSAAEPLPLVAAATPRRKKALLSALVAFRRAHRAAWEAFRNGLAVVFPTGSYKAWRWYGARRVPGDFCWGAAPS